MIKPRIPRWAGAGGAWLVTAVGLAIGASGAAPLLPTATRYANLPDLFNQTLQGIQAEVRSHGNDPEGIRHLARLYHANRLFPEARACYQVLAAAPAGLTARDHYYLADIDENEYDLAAAQVELRAVLHTEPGYLPARLALAEALFKSGEEKAAEKEYTAILATDANQPQASLGLARIELQRGDDDAAVARLEDLMAGHPEFTSGAGLFAQVLARRGETDRAIAMTQWSQQKPETPPADPWRAALLADCYDVQHLSLTFEEYFKLGKMDEALPLLDRLSVLDPNSPITKIFSGFSHAHALQHITAIREYYEALGKGGDPEKICPALVQSLLALGKVSEAAKLMADSYAKLPDSLPIAKAYAEVALREGDDALTRTLLEKVLAREPYLQAQNMSLARILWAAGERDEAARCLTRVATVFANDVASRALLGEYYLGKSEPFAAIKPLEQAEIYVTPKTPAQAQLTALLAAAYLQAGNAEAEKGRLPEAAGYYDQAIRRAPAEFTGYAGLANVCVQLRQFGRAADALEKLAVLDPANPTIQISLGDVIYQDGKTDQARQHWEKARQLAAAGDTDLRAALDDRLQGRITAETFK